MADLEHVEADESDQDGANTVELAYDQVLQLVQQLGIGRLIGLSQDQQAGSQRADVAQNGPVSTWASARLEPGEEETGGGRPAINAVLRQGPAAVLVRLHWADILLPLSLALWGLGVSRTNTQHLGSYGLLRVLPPVFFAGVLLLLLSVGSELYRAKVSSWRMAAHAAALVVVLYATAPLVYPEGRYQWLYKTIGVTQYVNAHGQLDRYIDIYNNWPGFFAFTAWFDKVAGVSTALDYAKWSQLIVELAALPLLSLAFGALSLPIKQRWMAVLMYSASNWIGQDYYSPQALGTLLSLGIVATTLRWFYSGNSAGSRAAIARTQAITVEDRVGERPPPVTQRSRLVLCCVLLLFFVLTFTHEISPYLLIAQVGGLALLRLVRPRWLPAALAVVAIGFMAPRFGFINSHYGVLRSIGDFFRNVAPPSSTVGTIPLSQRRVQYAADLLSVFIWGLAIAGIFRLRHSRRTVIALAVLAFSPILVLVVGAYGNEGLLRVYLFSLPWSAALASAVLVPAPSLAEGRVTPDGRHARSSRRRIGLIRAPACLAACVALFFPAFFGEDSSNVMSQAEVSDVTAFLTEAPAGPIYGPNLNAPLADTSRYNLFPLHVIFGAYGLPGSIPTKTSIAAQIADNARTITKKNQPAYVIVTPAMRAYNEAYNVVPGRSFAILLNSLAHSPDWTRVLNHAGTVIYELRIIEPLPVPNLPG